MVHRVVVLKQIPERGFGVRNEQNKGDQLPEDGAVNSLHWEKRAKTNLKTPGVHLQLKHQPIRHRTVYQQVAVLWNWDQLLPHQPVTHGLQIQQQYNSIPQQMPRFSLQKSESAHHFRPQTVVVATLTLFTTLRDWIRKYFRNVPKSPKQLNQPRIYRN